MYQETDKKLTIWELINHSPATEPEKSKFNKSMTDLGYGLFEAIKFDDYMITANNHPCFIKWLMKTGRIVEKKKEMEVGSIVTVWDNSWGLPLGQNKDKEGKRGYGYFASGRGEFEVLAFADSILPTDEWSYSKEKKNNIILRHTKDGSIYFTQRRFLKLVPKPDGWKIPISRITPLANAVQKLLDYIFQNGRFSSREAVGNWVKGKIDLWIIHSK